MSVKVPTTKVPVSEAVTITSTIVTVVDGCVEEFGEEAVTKEVITAKDELAETSVPLAALLNTDGEGKRLVDIASDHCLGGIHSTCDDVIDTYSQELVPLKAEQQLELTAAKAIMISLFPQGVTFLRERRTIQYGTTENLILRAQEEANLAHLTTLGLLWRFDLLLSLHKLYGEKMGYTQSAPDDSQLPLAIWYEALERYLAAVIYKHKQGSVLRERLSAPYDKNAQAYRDAQRGTVKAAAKKEPSGTGLIYE